MKFVTVCIAAIVLILILQPHKTFEPSPLILFKLRHTHGEILVVSGKSIETLFRRS